MHLSQRDDPLIFKEVTTEMYYTQIVGKTVKGMCLDSSNNSEGYIRGI